jgi:hypothetical protein
MVDIIFDATGGRLKECSHLDTLPKELSVKVKKKKFNFEYAGVKQSHNIPVGNDDSLEIILRKIGHTHEPLINGKKISAHMAKITNIPIEVLNTVRTEQESRDTANLFYYWSGCLKPQLNVGLIMVNILPKENIFLSSMIKEPISVNSLVAKKNQINIEMLNSNIVYMLQRLAELDLNDEIKIEIPFTYEPYINFSAGTGLINGIFPVGDSLFCGHPKVGNGLGRHLQFINQLIDQTKSSLIS